MKNEHQIKAFLFENVALDGCSVDTVATRLRDIDLAAYKATKNGKALEKLAEDMKAQFDGATGPLAQRFMALHYAEIGLRGDLEVALTQIDIADPTEIRVVVDIVQALASRDTAPGHSCPAEISTAIDKLEAHGFDVEQYRARRDALYPA